MSSAFDLLKSFGDSKPYNGFTKLKIGNYEILNFRLVNNKMYKEKKEGEENNFLKRILMVELKDQVLFLPQYFARQFDDDDKKVAELNNDGVKKFLFFGGARPNR